MTKETEGQLSPEASGFVYVFDKALFSEREGREFMTYERAVPTHKIQVRLQDLPPYQLFQPEK